MANVTKEYLCEKCGEIEFIQNHEEVYKKCPVCKSPIERLLSAAIIAKDGSPRTIGKLMEQNNKKNKHEREKVMGEITEKKLAKQAHFRKLANATPEQKKRYIEQGIL